MTVNEACLGTGSESPSEVLQNEFQRLHMTDFLYRFSGVIQNRFFGNRRGGGGIAANAGDDMTGRAAGDGFDNWSPWISYARTRSSNDLASTAYKGTADSFLLGADYTFSDRLVAGVSLGYDDSNIDTRFNNGGYETEGYTIAPYVAYLLTDTISVDGTLGYSNMNIDQSRTNPIDGNRIVSDTDSDRWFVAANVNKFHQYGNFMLLGRAGLIYSEDDRDGFSERGSGGQTVASNRSEFGQVQIGGEVAYSVHAIEPYASVYYQYDFENETPVVAAGQPRPSGDDDEYRLSGGFRYFGNNGFSGVVEYSGSTGRDNFDSHTLTFIARLQF